MNAEMTEIERQVAEVGKRMRDLFYVRTKLIRLQNEFDSQLHEVDSALSCLCMNFEDLKSSMEDEVEFIRRTDSSSQYSSEKIEIDFEKNWKCFVESCGRTIEEYPYEKFSPFYETERMVIERAKNILRQMKVNW